MLRVLSEALQLSRVLSEALLLSRVLSEALLLRRVLSEALLLSTHNIRFSGEVRKNICLDIPLIWSFDIYELHEEK